MNFQLPHGFNAIFYIILIFFSVVIFSFETQVLADKNGDDITPECDIQKSACTKVLTDYQVTLNIEPRPIKAMTDLTFEVTLDGKVPIEPPYIDLGMPGMNMGRNQVILKSISKNIYKGMGVIVRCPSGKRTWKASVTIPNVGTVEYIFDVIY